MQLETLAAFYYGEVEITIVTGRNIKSGLYYDLVTYIWRGKVHQNISGRVRSLFKRKLIRSYFWGEGSYEMVVVVLPAGVEELEKINA